MSQDIKNIADAFVATSKKMGSRSAIIEAESGRTITFADLNAQSDGYARYLYSCGLRPGEKVMLMVSPSIDFIALSIALFKIGVTIILIDPGMGFRNLLRCIERVKPQVLIGIPKAVIFAKIFRKAFRSVSRYFCCGKSILLPYPDITMFGNIKSSSFSVYSPQDNDLAAIIFTTGSTGPPKGVRYEHSIFAAQLRQIKDYYKISDKDVDQPAFPLFALFSTAIGACAVIPDMDPTRPAKVDAQKFVDSINKYKVTYSFGSPAIWNVVTKYCERHGLVLESVRKILMAGAPVPYELLQRGRNSLPADAEIHTPYGATESLPIASIESREILQDTWKSSRIGKGTCVGRPLPGTDIKIIGISDSPIEEFHDTMVLGPGEIGEIIVKGDVVTRGYENNESETRLAKIKDTADKSFWHRMGDTGYLDELGRLWFCGRRAHRVVTGKQTYYSIPCEAIINEHPEVYRSALVGVGTLGEQIPVFVVETVKDHPVDEKKLLQELSEAAKENKLTRDIEHFLVHRDFPVDIRHNAKIFREKLAVWAEGRMQRC